MDILPLLLAHLTKVALVVLLAGILWRGRARLCWSFALYVLAVLTGNVLVSVWPSRFFNPSFWVAKQAVYDALKVAVVLELAWRAFSRLAAAPRTGRAVVQVLHHWQRAILLGLAAYLLVFVVPVGLARRQGWTIPGPVTTAEAIAFFGLLAFWTWAAWRGEAARGPAVPPGTLA